MNARVSRIASAALLRSRGAGLYSNSVGRHAGARCISSSSSSRNSSDGPTTEETAADASPPQWKVVYEGPFEGTLKRLRRVSIVSAIGSAIGLPVAYVFGIPSASISMAGQVGIIGTVLLSSLSSTFFLQLVTSPYVTRLYELQGENADADADTDKNRHFKAERLNYFGNALENRFVLAETSRVASTRHPYASCEAGGTYMYYHGKAALPDEKLRLALTNN